VLAANWGSAVDERNDRQPLALAPAVQRLALREVDSNVTTTSKATRELT